MQQYYEVPSLDLTVRKSVIDGVVERVLMESGIEKPDIVYVDSFNTAHQPDSTLGEETNPEYASTERIYVEVSDERDEMSRINRNVGMGNEIPFFKNDVDQVKAARALDVVSVNGVATCRSVVNGTDPNCIPVNRWCTWSTALAVMPG